MKKVLYGLASLVLGISLHIIFNRYLANYGIGPHLLLLFVVAHGFLVGPMMGEILGFCWGLTMDAMGVNLFGLQSLLFALAGYLAGKLRRRVASERISTQLFIAVITTGYYFLGSYLIRTVLEVGHQAITFTHLFLALFFNILLVTAVFWVMEWWVAVWRVNQENL